MDPISLALSSIAVLVALIYVFLTWNFDHWRKKGIRTAPSWPLVGSFPSIFTGRRNIAYDYDDIYDRFKDTDKIVGVFNTRRPQLLVTCPEYISKIYTTDFRSFHNNEWEEFRNKKADKILADNPFFLTGDEWKEKRSEITPGLSPNRIKAVYPISQSVCKKFVNFIKRQQKKATSQGLDAMELSLCYTTEVVSDCVLGISAQSFEDTCLPMVRMTQSVFNSSFGFIFFNMLANIWPTIRKFYSVAFYNKEVVAFFSDIIKRCITLRQTQTSSTEQRDDFLNYMLQLQKKKGLNMEELTTHTMALLTDGFETTAMALAHTLLNLARHPEEQQKVLEEIGSADFSFEQLSDLPYLDACLHETLRIFSPQIAARKKVTETYDFVNTNGLTLRANPGDVVTIPVKAVHHDPQYYENPECFKPQRFLEANGEGVKGYRERGVFLAFGNGPRICPGMRFALTQIKAALVQIVRHFEIKVNPKTRSDDHLDDTFFMATLKGGIWLDFKERQ